MPQGKGRFFSVSRNKRFVTFDVGSVLFGIDIEIVKEAVVCPKLRREDWLPEFVDGYMKLRGLGIPAFDLRRVFGFKADFNAETRIMLSSFNGRIAGLVVDGIRDVELSGADDDAEKESPKLDEAKGPPWARYVSAVYDSPVYGKIHMIDPAKIIGRAESDYLDSMLPEDPCP